VQGLGPAIALGQLHFPYSNAPILGVCATSPTIFGYQFELSPPPKPYVSRFELPIICRTEYYVSRKTFCKVRLLWLLIFLRTYLRLHFEDKFILGSFMATLATALCFHGYHCLRLSATALSNPQLAVTNRA
jgi:hypothetical protein